MTSTTGKTPKRIYRVRCENSGDSWLVRATSGAQAIKHVASHYSAAVATTDEVAELVAAGRPVETAGEQPAGDEGAQACE